jgi:hypothetical protein
MDTEMKRKLAGAAAGVAIAAGAAGVADAVTGGSATGPQGPPPNGPPPGAPGGPGGPPPPPFGHPPPGHPGLDAAAKYLGLTNAQLFQRLRSGKSLAEIAANENKSVQGLKDALVAEFRKHVDELVNRKPGRFPPPGRRHFRHRAPHW